MEGLRSESDRTITLKVLIVGIGSKVGSKTNTPIQITIPEYS